MSEVLKRWNTAAAAEAAHEIRSCCGSGSWTQQLASRRPFADAHSLLLAADQVWRSLQPSDWLEAFHSHPRIGESTAKAPLSSESTAWSSQEQRNVTDSKGELKAALADANCAYEQKFGHIFIVCASGKSASEILAILRRRMHNDGATELREAAEQQRQITQLRLKKWLGI